MDANRIVTALLVDDDPQSQQANQERLEADGYSVVLVRDPNEGLARARERAPDVIFVHLVGKATGNLPFIQALRSDDSCRHIRVVLLRGEARSEQRPLQRLRAVPRDGG